MTSAVRSPINFYGLSLRHQGSPKHMGKVPGVAEQLQSAYNFRVVEDRSHDRLRGVLEAAPSEVLAAYLYGSRARGSSKPGSDLDLAILLRQTPPPTLRSAARDIEGAVERALRMPTQVVVLNSAPADLTHRVLRDGIVLLDRDRAARIRFEVQARNEYFDLASVRRLYRRLPA